MYWIVDDRDRTVDGPIESIDIAEDFVEHSTEPCKVVDEFGFTCCSRGDHT